MLCGNSAALNNYEIEQDILERTAYEADQDSAEIAKELMNGEEFHKHGQSWSMNDVVDQIVDQDESLREIIKSLALNINNPLKQTKTVEKLNALIREYSFCVAEIME
ncbi:hypothetical protein H0A36_25345 [Endozoicomonas sp. SM1973]|uniref:Uncharacterized protein n=1 Tax=Spartinivicinus marinus TaxID=2994442 RepID=A0A853IFN1_9GAMM|nr:hypothetical protein [Spartinivicinus marinus]NYZ69348.1 hypothetical protein [Spartinivicinus marinus]